MAPTGAAPDEALALFRETPETFIASRDALAARLRDDGRAEDAATVKSLRKPTVVAWALNQLAVVAPDRVQALLDSGAEVRAAQQAALSSKRGATDRLRSASAARKGAVADLTGVALRALADAGKGSDTHADAIVQALETCSVDPEAGSALSSGALERPPAASAGFGGVFGLTSLEGGDEAAAGDPASGRGARARSGSARAAAGAGPAELKAEVSRLRRDRDAAERRARKSRAAADGFAHELEGMRRRLEVVERKHADAEAAAGEAELEAARVEKALQEAIDRAGPATSG